MTGILKHNGQSENFRTTFVNGIHEVSHFMNHIMKENCANQVFPKCFTEFTEFSDKKYLSLQ